MSCDPAKLLLLGSDDLLIKDLIGVCRDRCDRWRVGHIKGMSVMTRNVVLQSWRLNVLPIGLSQYY